jgi:hypothetical protein
MTLLTFTWQLNNPTQKSIFLYFIHDKVQNPFEFGQQLKSRKFIIDCDEYVRELRIKFIRN